MLFADSPAPSQKLLQKRALQAVEWILNHEYSSHYIDGCIVLIHSRFHFKSYIRIYKIKYNDIIYGIPLTMIDTPTGP